MKLYRDVIVIRAHFSTFPPLKYLHQIENYRAFGRKCFASKCFGEHELFGEWYTASPYKKKKEVPATLRVKQEKSKPTRQQSIRRVRNWGKEY